jgi:hypothetical protein
VTGIAATSRVRRYPPRRGWVFVSYAREDKGRVRPIVDFLKKRRIEVWWDDLLLPGDDWGWMLREKLNDAACVVVVWSDVSIRSRFVESEARAVLDRARGSGRLVPVLIDKRAASSIPLPFDMFHTVDLSDWDGRTTGPVASLGKAVVGLVKRPPRSEEQRGQSLADDYAVESAIQASTEMRQLSQSIRNVGEILTGDVDAVRDLGGALDEVHKTLDVVAGAVEEFVTAGLQPDGLDPRPYVRFERGALSRRIGDDRGHCDLIAVHYGKSDGLRAWLKAHASKELLVRADEAFGRLSQADGDLFRWLAQIGHVLTNESRVVVNLLTAAQREAARLRVIDGRNRLAPLEADLQKSVEVLQEVEHSLGFARSRGEHGV